MKKTEYNAPSMEVVTLVAQGPMLSVVSGNGEGSSSDANDPISGGSGEIED